ncbi:Hypothetical protein PHPALM_11997 [Phytophthora palmivora]|uniref:Uncharacterized protein n=1 Tax=Phytophthora palmivora TaxID=4796 RepID=A0A2P4Y0V4_9STRA|nr:Hypothetical protein PHPALM_11997 [Phytophthora palmivora]
MASRDLVGRPLVPFFDSDDNVNDSLQLADGDDEHEEMDVDARVWDKELGYFVYPSEQQSAVSKSMTIAVTNRESRTDSGNKLLLTPSMMLSSIGRPLVPFFDSDDNVNDSLQLADGDDEHEEMDVDARVWDKELGYFVYPSEQQSAVSKSMTIAVTNRESRTDSGSKLLLTPSMMLSSSAPEHFNSMAANGNPVQATTAILGTENSYYLNAIALRSSTDDANVRSSSTKRGSKQKSRSNTPARRRKDKEGDDDGSVATTPSSKKGKNKSGNTNSNGAQANNNRNGKQKEQLSASGKWAWSAFQSSPDPTELPMPPFLTKQVGDVSNGNTATSVTKPPAPPLPPTPPPTERASVPFAPPLPPGSPPSQPPQPPLPPMPTAPPEVTSPAPMSVELSMTQDLRRMLNIGGG